MMQTAINILLPLVVLLVLLFLVFRLRLFAEERVSGRWAFLIGGILLVLAAVWRSVSGVSSYGDWFILSVYPYLELAHFLLFVAGVVLVVTGLAFYADWWQTRREDLEVRDQKLSILDNIQRDARGPYQLLDLLNLAVKEIVSSLPGSAGAVFLLNRKRRQFVLTASVGLKRDETALLEYYPLQRNVVSQSIDVGEPLLGSQFSFVDREGNLRGSRFQSVLVLPLVSGVEKIGGILLLNEEDRYFGRSDIRYLQPVAEWVAEKIKSARLERDLSSAGEREEALEAARDELTRRLKGATKAFGSAETVPTFCKSLVGVADSRSVHLFGLANGTLTFFGGSEPLGALSENYRTALVDTLDRTKPLVINQEGTTEDGRTYTAVSSLVVPLGSAGALLLRKEQGPFHVSDSDLTLLEIFAGMATLVLHRADTDRLDLTRRKGFEPILRLLRFDRETPLEDQPDFLPRLMAPALPEESTVLLFLRQENAAMKAAGGIQVPSGIIGELEILPGEGIVGQAAAAGESRFVHGRGAVGKSLEAFEAEAREQMHQLFGERGTPDFMAACPVLRMNKTVGVLLFMLHGVTEKERGEWERLLTLAGTLYSIRLTIRELNERAGSAAVELSGDEVDRGVLGNTVNQLNNYLSAVIGNAELAASRTDLSGEVQQHLRSIIGEAESAAGYLKEALGKMNVKALSGEDAVSREATLGSALSAVLRRLSVSEGLYMAGGRAREISVAIDEDAPVPLPEGKLLGLIEEMLNRFGASASDEDMLTVQVYRRENSLYMDLSRHRKNFPPVEEVAEFGSYSSVEAVFEHRPSDTFLRYVADSDVLYAYDRVSQPPSYLSFRFSIAGTRVADRASGEPVRILAIDDQTVILDLIVAMSQSMGYEVHTASSGPEGIDLARKNDYSIVLTDLAMPGMSGLEAAREIRELLPETPIVLVTGWEVNTDRSELAAAGVVEVLYKPFRIEQLTDLIRSAVKNPSR